MNSRIKMRSLILKSEVMKHSLILSAIHLPHHSQELFPVVSNTITIEQTEIMAPKKVLFACAPFDGHFNPLTGLAVHLLNEGHDVRWYAQDYYAEKLKKLHIPHYPFMLAQQLNQDDLEVIFPERKKITGMIRKVNFDIQNVFIKQGPLYYQDIVNIENEFDFDLLIADTAFTGVPYVKELMAKPVFTIGVVPLSETSKDLAPSGLGMTPSKTLTGGLKQDILHYVAKNLLLDRKSVV